MAPRARVLARIPWLTIAFLAVALPLILLDVQRGRGQFDQHYFHEPVIRRFAAQMDRAGSVTGVDLSNYLSATTPGYHLALALVCRWVDCSLIILKLVGSLFTVALLAILESALRRRIAQASPDPPAPPPLLHLALGLPVLCSMYLLVPGAWLQPDNAGWLGVLAMLLIALRTRWDNFSLLAGALVMLALVWVRQSHIWAAGLLWVGAWIGGAARAAAGQRSGLPIAFALGSSVRWMLSIRRGRLVRLALAFAATLPAVASLFYFHRLWNGLTPPHFQQQHAAAWNPATPALVLTLLAIYSCFFIAWTWPGLARLWRERKTGAGGAGGGGWLILIPCIVIGLLLAAIPVTTFEYEARASGLWELVRIMDERKLSFGMRTSPILLLGAPLGIVLFAAWLIQLPRRRAWVYALALLGFTLAQSANANAWQRYLEPMLLITLALMAADLAARPASPLPPPWWVGGRRALVIGPVLLALVLAAVTIRELSAPRFDARWPIDPLGSLSDPVPPPPTDPAPAP